MRFHRTLTVLAVVLGLVALGAVSHATPLTPFIDLQEKGLTLVADGVGLEGWGGGPTTLTVNVGGSVRFALLYWAGRERPCTETPAGSGDCSGFAEPFKDQEVIFNGVSLTGTVIGSESQPVSAGGPILNVGYFADVTSLVSAAGPGLHNFSFSDGNLASNLWRPNGVGLLVAYTDAASTTTYRVQVWDGLDFAWGPDPTPGETRVIHPVTFNHGVNTAARSAELWLLMGDGTADRPDRVDVSNNPSVFNGCDASNGLQWDLEASAINIPAGVGTTTVQAFSEPVNQNPDSLLWEVAALRVAQLDTAGPTCPTTVAVGPPAQATTTFRDTGSGLAELLVTRSENADTVVPPFTVGTTDPVVVTSTKIDQSQRARIEIRATDLAGNVSLCDPIHTLVVRENGKPAQHTYTDVPRAECIVTVMNGSKGVAHLEVLVNGTKFKLNDLADGEVRHLDVAAAMEDGDNVVTLKASGTPGGQADVILWEGGQ